MLSGIKIIPKEQLEGSDDLEGKSRPSTSRKPSRNAPVDSDGSKSPHGRRHRRRHHEKKHKSRRKSYSPDDASSETTSDEDERISRSRRKKRKELDSDDTSSSDGSSDGVKGKKWSQKKDRKRLDKNLDNQRDVFEPEDNEVARKEKGLEWMLNSGSRLVKGHVQDDKKPEECEVQEAKKTNPRELNPYLRDGGSGYPDEDASQIENRMNELRPSSVVGDGGVSWRLKALKRAKERAAADGLDFAKVVEDQMGSIGRVASTVASQKSAHAHAHLHAIKDRKMGQTNKSNTTASTEPGGKNEEVHRPREYLMDVSSRADMRKPNYDSISWKKRSINKVPENASLISEAFSSLNKFANDGSFMNEMVHLQNKALDLSDASASKSKTVDHVEVKLLPSNAKVIDAEASDKHVCSSNQLAAKVLQLRMKGKHEEAEKLLADMETNTEHLGGASKVNAPVMKGSMSRHAEKKATSDQKKREDDYDLNLAQKIIRSRKYSLSGSADDEYDYDNAPGERKHKRKEMPRQKSSSKHILTQKERCQFCFLNPSKPVHLIISIAESTYLMSPPWTPVVKGHCCILPMQHESSIRTVDDNVWEEIRNFKKCLLKMFAKKEMSVVFLETAINLSQQKRHCLLECIPIPYELADQAPMYFKKAIDEAEEEWGQHEMKKLIPTSGNLRHAIPENFAYFHVEFGLDRGFVHVIDDDSNFGSGFGLNVIRGLLRLPEEDMYRRGRRHDPPDIQKQAVATFKVDFAPFDWTEQLDY